MAKNVAQMMAKMQRGIANGGQSFEDGVSAVSEAPGQRAAQRADFWFQKLQEAKDSGKWEREVAAVPLSEWQAKTKAGKNRFVQSATQASQNWGQFAQAAQQIWEQTKAECASMPRGTMQDSVARVVKNMENMMRTKGLGKRGRR